MDEIGRERAVEVFSSSTLWLSETAPMREREILVSGRNFSPRPRLGRVCLLACGDGHVVTMCAGGAGERQGVRDEIPILGGDVEDFGAAIGGSNGEGLRL